MSETGEPDALDREDRDRAAAPDPAALDRGAPGSRPLDPEDAKIVTLARATRARSGAPEGAAVRDIDGRTYAASPVELPSLSLSALQLAVAMAVSSGAPDLEAAAVITAAGTPDAAGTAAVRDLAPRARLLVAGIDGAVHAVVTG